MMSCLSVPYSCVDLGDSLGGSLALLGDGGGTANGSRSRDGRFREVTKGGRGDLSHDGN